MPVTLTLLGRTGPPIQVQSLLATIQLAPPSMRAMGTLLDLLPFETLYVVVVVEVVVTGTGSTIPHLWKFTLYVLLLIDSSLEISVFIK